MIPTAGNDAASYPNPARRTSRMNRIVAAAASAVLAAAGLTFTAAVPAHADDAAVTVHTYAPTGVGGGTTTSPDVASTKYQVQVAGTSVEAVQYNQLGHNYDVARFASSSRTPTITVTLPSTTISTVNVYPARYYPASSVSVSSDQHTLTFQMSASAGLNEAIVMVNGDSTNAAGQPYLAIINDPLEDPSQRPDTTDAADGSGVNLQTGVLNFQEFAANYLAAHPNSTAQTAPSAATSSMAGQTVDGTAIPAGQQTSAGSLVSASSVNVRYPNERVMAANDDTYALQAAIQTIENNPTQLNTLYFPDGTYIWSGLLINGLDGSKLLGGKLKIYVDEGALLENRIQAYMEAFEPEIGIINSSNIEIDGRGIFDGNGAANYNASSSGDLHDAYRSQHQGGVMVMHSSNITFNDTYERNAKQWNWETHSANNITFNNIKGLTPYSEPWSDGTDFASGQNITANHVFTLGNDDAFASGHYNSSNGFTPLNSDVWNNFSLGTSSANVQGYVNAVGAYDTVAAFLGFNSNNWDNEDSKNISVSNTLNWTYGPGNAIRLGYQTLGHQLTNYTFDNLNSLSATAGGITVMNNSNTYPRVQSVTIKNSSIDTSRYTTGGISIGGGDGTAQTITAAQQANNGYAPNPDGSGTTYTYTKSPISTIDLDNVWFSKPTANSMTGVTNATLNNIYIAGEPVEYSNQLALSTTGVANLTSTYTDANGQTQNVKANSLPTFTSPTVSSYTASNDNALAFTVAATDPDQGDSVALSASGLPTGATFDASTGSFLWKPTASQVGNTYAVVFSAADDGAQAGLYAPTTKTIAITVGSAAYTYSSNVTTGDTWVGAWSGDQATNNSSDLTLITRNTGVGLMGEQYTTGSGDGKLSYLQFDLSGLTQAPSQAALQLTYVGHRTATVPATDTDQLLVQPVSDTVCTGGGTSCPISTMTWKNRPSFTATSSSVAESASFTLGSVIVPEGGGTHQGNAIDGRKITVDITTFVQNAIAAGQTSLLLAVGDTGTTHELRFVSSEGATGSGKMTNATADMAPTLLLANPKPVAITGPTAQTIAADSTGSSNAFQLAGVAPFAVTLSGDTAGGKITWNDATDSLAFASGIPAGTHQLTLNLTTADGKSASATFTLTATALAATVSAASVESAWGTAATVTVQVAGASDTPTGTVTLTEGGTARGTATLSGGTSSFTLPVGLAAGVHTLTATYSGDQFYASANTNVQVTVDLPTAWSAKTVYNKGDRVSYQGNVYVASWYSQNQTPGDPYGSWQQLAMTEDGTTIWTASRIFNTGDVAVYQGTTYKARWYTRNQTPGAPNGPWAPIG